MTHLPENDPTLVPQLKTSRRFLHWLSGDPVETYYANVRADDVEQKRSSYTFVVKDDAVIDMKPRNYQVLTERLTAEFDSVATHLTEANIRNRVGVFVEIDAARALVAHYEGPPSAYAGRENSCLGRCGLGAFHQAQCGHRPRAVGLFAGRRAVQ